ncbi:Isochorismatase-like protein [Lipomyces oligophaga]|uniref:Isochorismatase-like protein n=1 Tax=Lipomyces oligophaga TaxID=45792 RepID=UPI0034CFE7F6
MAYKLAENAPVKLESAALLVIDMQQQFRHTAARLLPTLIPLISEFTKHGRPVIFTQHGHLLDTDNSQLVKWWGAQGSIKRFSPAWQLMPELLPFSDDLSIPNVHVLRNKDRYDAFLHTGLDRLLESLGVTSVVITGTLTNLCCETTARTAFNLDYYVYFPSDGTATHTAIFHEASLTNLRFGFAQITTVANLMSALHLLPVPVVENRKLHRSMTATRVHNSKN